MHWCCLVQMDSAVGYFRWVSRHMTSDYITMLNICKYTSSFSNSLFFLERWCELNSWWLKPWCLRATQISLVETYLSGTPPPSQQPASALDPWEAWSACKSACFRSACSFNIGFGFLKWVYHLKWMRVIMENPIKLDDLGVPLGLRKPPFFCPSRVPTWPYKVP